MAERGKPRLSERHPHEAFRPEHLPPGKAGRTWIAKRYCNRCRSIFPHPLAPGWCVEPNELDGGMLYVCPGCARPDDLNTEGKTNEPPS